MTADEARTRLEDKMRRRFDGHSCSISVTDAHAISALLRYDQARELRIAELEGALAAARFNADLAIRSRDRWKIKARAANRKVRRAAA